MSSITQSRNQHLAGQPGKATTGWTDEHEKILRRIWGAGGSARQIAETIGSGFTRNAVISKVRRLGLHRNPLGPRKSTPESKPAPERKNFMSAQPEQRTRDRASYPKPTPLDIVKYEQPSDGVGVSFLELTNESCRWPKGTPGEPGFVFCGEATADLRDGKPYCPFHMRKRRVS